MRGILFLGIVLLLVTALAAKHIWDQPAKAAKPESKDTEITACPPLYVLPYP